MKPYNPEFPMPVGKYRDQPIGTLSTPYLAWFISQDNIRFKYRKATASALAELRLRFQAEGKLEAELLAPETTDDDDCSDLI